MKRINRISVIVVTLIFSIIFSILGQDKRTISGRVISSQNEPIEGAIVTISQVENVSTFQDGTFTLSYRGNESTQISVWSPGYYSVSQPINGREQVTIMMIREDQYKYNESLLSPFQIEGVDQHTTSTMNISNKDFKVGSMKVDRALSGQVPGLQVIQSSGMPGEGSYLNIRGIRSLISENAPLIVINGVPYLPDQKESQLINGFSRNIFQAFNIENIQNITVLKGATTSLYGSMGSNGVILIETDEANSTDLETKISYYGQYGVSWNNQRLPLLQGIEYKSYLSDVGMTYYDNMMEFLNDFQFLSDPNNRFHYLYNNSTDWQSEIYRNGFISDNMFKVEGGDAIAKYNLSLGYMSENGTLHNTSSQRYHTLLNTNVLISPQMELSATFGLAFLNGKFQDQGMINQTNPVLAAYAKSPVLSPYEHDIDGNVLSSYSSYHFGRLENMDFAMSNPLAITQTLDIRSRQYDINIKATLGYKIRPNLTLTGSMGFFYNYNKESKFVPGLNDQAILPFYDQFGEAQNTVKVGIAETRNHYYDLNLRYNNRWSGGHVLNLLAGSQAIVSMNEYDLGSGRNTASDFYQTLNNTQSIGRFFTGYLEKWNWMNLYGHANYTYNQKLSASVNMSLDGASSVGAYGNHFSAYPSVGVTWLGKGWLPISNSTYVNLLNVRAECGLTGNSRFSSKFGKFYYSNLPYQNISGIVRGNISNTKLKPENNVQLNVGIDTRLFSNRLDISLDLYHNRTKDVIFALPQSSVFGTARYYDNLGEIENKGIELSFQASPVRTPSFEWIVGGNIALNNNKVVSLGGYDHLITEFSDGAQMVTKAGESPYQFYGFRALGVFSTQNEAESANLKNKKGHSFLAGDIHFEDINGDHIIDDRDRVLLGDPAPKYFGGFYTRVSYNSFALTAEFTYSKGNQAYNVVRRNLESLSSFGNQSTAVMNRWNLEGQITDIPRAQWNDPLGNSSFSSRWIEDASYIRMKNITFSYDFEKRILNFIRSGKLYVSGENLLTMTNYLGLDPEFSYSQSSNIQGFDLAKLIQPRVIKFGVNLQF
jgi:TonB-linked SusC/RagA family outer membrane protein